MQGRGGFFCRGGVSEFDSNDLLRCTDEMDKENADWQSAENEEENASLTTRALNKEETG